MDRHRPRAAGHRFQPGWSGTAGALPQPGQAPARYRPKPGERDWPRSNPSPAHRPGVASVSEGRHPRLEQGRRSRRLRHGHRLRQDPHRFGARQQGCGAQPAPGPDRRLPLHQPVPTVDQRDCCIRGRFRPLLRGPPTLASPVRGGLPTPERPAGSGARHRRHQRDLSE